MSYNLGHVVGEDGRGIVSIEKTGTSGLVDTYTITYSDGTTSSFEVTNGEGGADIVTSWETTLSDTKVPSEKLTKNTLDTKQATLVSGTNIKTINNNSLLGSGNIDIQGSSVDIVTSWESTLSDSKVPSEKLTKDNLDGKVDKVTGKGLSTEDYTSTEKTKLSGIETGANNYTHPSSKQCNYAPDLSNYVQKSSTSGLIKNDGSIDTSSYLTTGTASSTYIPKTDIVDNLTTNDNTKVLSAKQGKVLYDLIAGIENDMLS